MSGGVDSSVAAHLLLEQGHEVIGVFMRHGEQSPVACGEWRGASGEARDISESRASQLAPRASLHHKQGCCTAADAEDARRVADKLGIVFYALNLQEEFGQIIDYFVAEYTAGRTPNPCVQCNNWIKFGKLFDYADSVGAEFVATGHYARIENRGEGSVVLLRGLDAAKDQSYVLFGIRRELLRRMMLPVGGFEKPAIRRIAAELGLRVAEKKDSQEICFVTLGRYDEFVRGRGAGGAAGELVTTAGKVVGEHNGPVEFGFSTNNAERHIRRAVESIGCGIRLQSVRLDDFQPEKRYAMGKMDIEGAEPMALRGCAERLRQSSPPVWLLEIAGYSTCYGIATEEVISFLSEAGYRCAIYEPTLRRITYTDSPWECGVTNVLAISASHESFVEERIVATSGI